jgi:hypothetical protein
MYGAAMIRFVMTGGHAYTVRALVKEARAPHCEVVTYDRLFASRRLPRAVYVFTDFDRLGAWDLELAARVAKRLVEKDVPVLNHPARSRTRWGLLRALHEAGINDFNAYRVEERVRPSRWPVFIRREGGHRKPLSDLLDDWSAVCRAVDEAVADGVPDSQIVIIEYAGEPVRPGIFRKLSECRIGDVFTAQPAVHEDSWLVKYGRLGVATPELYEEELEVLRTNRYADDIAPAFEIAGLEYGRADFGLVGGRVQIWEINSNPVVSEGGDHPVELHQESQTAAWDAVLEAMQRLASRAPTGPPVEILDKGLRRHQRGALRRARSRFVP